MPKTIRTILVAFILLIGAITAFSWAGANYSFTIGGLHFSSGANPPASCSPDGSFFFKTATGWYQCVGGVYTTMGGGAAYAGVTSDGSNGLVIAGALQVGPGVTNDGSTGTTNKLLAKFNASGNLVKAGTSDTAIPVYIVVSGGGTTGSAYVATSGTATCTFDGAATINHFVQLSTTTAGDCHDTASTTAPTSNWVIGRVASTSCTGGAGDCLVEILQGYNATSSGSGGAPMIQWFPGGTQFSDNSEHYLGTAVVGQTSNQINALFTVSHNCTAQNLRITIGSAQPAATLVFVVKSVTASNQAVGAAVGTLSLTITSAATSGSSFSSTGTASLTANSVYLLSGTEGSATGVASGAILTAAMDCQ